MQFAVCCFQCSVFPPLYQGRKLFILLLTPFVVVTHFFHYVEFVFYVYFQVLIRPVKTVLVVGSVNFPVYNGKFIVCSILRCV